MKLSKYSTIFLALFSATHVLAKINTTTTESSAQPTMEILQALLHVNETNITTDEKQVLARIDGVSGSEKACFSEDGQQDHRMRCIIDNLIKGVTLDLENFGVTDVHDQVNELKWDQLLYRLYYTMEANITKEDIPFRATLNRSPESNKEFYLWSNRGPEFNMFMEMTTELKSLLVHDEALTFMSKWISPFILKDQAMTQEAILQLTEDPMFALKPLDPEQQNVLFNIREQIYAEVEEQKNQNASQTAFFIPFDHILRSNFISWRSQTNESDVTKQEDQSQEESLVIMNAIFRSLVGDLLGVVLDLPGKLLGNGNGGGITITIGIGNGNGDSSSGRKHRSNF